MRESEPKIYYQLPRWPKHRFAEQTIEKIVSVFKSLSDKQQQQILRACEKTVWYRTNDWSGFNFWQPDELWNYLNALLPIFTSLPDAFELACTLRVNRVASDPTWSTLIAKWQPPTELQHLVTIKTKPYRDTGKNGYTVLTLKRNSDKPLKHHVGDHGFFVALAVIYFCFSNANRSFHQT
ncbi:hypothetical protein WG68_12510 [Arsukibacterium ikkense]|uniref:Uncharacterized protein n=2 Tax=Arsukibacterium ikkense TaxID=336831 RepID=A0A0M2V5M6_9GAMM|nr:hypothetical protein WG68_12510 [Arsukibacterium ikkense]